MSAEPRHDVEQRRALQLLAQRADGCTEAVLRARGFVPELIVSLVRARHATARPERMIVAGNAVSVTRIKITESGHEASGERMVWPPLVTSAFAASRAAVCTMTKTCSPMSSAAGSSILRKYIGFAPGG
jgi:hypothetical protein